jgi:hypothetical protein
MEHDGNKLANSKVLARCTGTPARACNMKASQRTTNPSGVSRRGRNSYGDGGAASASSMSLATHAASQSKLASAHRSVRRAFPRDDPPHVLIWRLNSPHTQGTPAAPRRERPFQLARAGSHDHIGSGDVASVVRSWLERGSVRVIQIAPIQMAVRAREREGWL